MPLIANSTQTATTPRRKAGPKTVLKNLHEGTAPTRRRAALDLIGVPAARDVLIERLGQEPQAGVRAGIIDALISMPDQSVIDVMIDTLRVEDAQRRNEAVTALQQMAGPMGTRMEQLLADPDPDVRILAVDVLRLLPSEDAPRWLIQLLERETHENVIGTALDRLAEIGGPEHLATVRAIRDRFETVPYIRFAADLVITRIEGHAKDSPGAEGGP